MPSFDIVSEVDLQEVDNAVNQASKEISTRFDFRGGKSSVDFAREEKCIKIVADDELKLRSIHQILEQKIVKRGIDLRALNYGPEQEQSGSMLKQDVSLKVGLRERRREKDHQGDQRQQVKSPSPAAR